MLDLPPSVGRYGIVCSLGTGGMAEVLLARMTGPGGFDRPVVVKRMLPHLASQEEFRSMFLDEARLAAGIQHPNVVTVFDFGESGDDLFLVMEHLHGRTLGETRRRTSERKEPIDSALAAYIIAEAANGLHAAHEYVDPDGVPQRVVHRDVSPQNLFVTFDGAVKVIDFGIAKAASRNTKTATGTTKGKFAYMSPEQCDGSPVDRRTDVFALGIVLHELLTRRRLFRRENQLDTVRAICLEPIPAPSEAVEGIPARLDAITRRALARSADERYATAADLRKDLLEAIQEMAPGRSLREELAARMHVWFEAEREKDAELLRRRPLPPQPTRAAVVDAPLAPARAPSRWVIAGVLAMTLLTAVLAWTTLRASPPALEPAPIVEAPPVPALPTAPAVEPPVPAPIGASRGPAPVAIDGPTAPGTSVVIEPPAPPVVETAATESTTPRAERPRRARPPTSTTPSAPAEPAPPPPEPHHGFGRVD